MARLPALLIAAAVVGSSLAVYSTDEQCNPDNPESFRCHGSNVHCENKKCTCDGGLVGDPFIECVPEGHKLCLIRNDPRAKTFVGEPDNKGIDLPVPCKFLAASFEAVPRGDYPSPLKHCTSEIYTASRRFRGKFFVHSYEVVLAYQKQDWTRGEVSFRASAETYAGTMTATLEARIHPNDYQDADKLIDDIFNEIGGGDRNVFKVNPDLLKVELVIPNCALRVHFRPADTFHHDQAKEPGLQIAADELNFDVDHINLKNSLCLSSTKSEVSVSSVAAGFKMVPDMAFSFRALAGVDVNDHDLPGTPSKQCGLLAEMLQDKCSGAQLIDERAKGMKNCFFILDHGHFINCYYRKYNDIHSSDRLVELFHMCMEGYCTSDTGLCRDAQQKISDESCKHLGKPSFVDFNCDYNAIDIGTGTGTSPNIHA